jgi:hypothetical protein
MGMIRFLSNVKYVVYDFNGNLIEDKRKDIEWWQMNNYYWNDLIFMISHNFVQKKNIREYDQSNYFQVYDYSNGILLDSLLIGKYESEQFVTFNWGTFFQHQDNLYAFYGSSSNRDFDTLYVYKNKQFVPFSRIKLTKRINENNKLNGIYGMSVTDRYVIVKHGFRNVSSPNVITRELISRLRPEEDYSYYLYDYKTGKSINSYRGFIDDVHHKNDTVAIKSIDGSNSFFFTRDGEYSFVLKTETNPKLYIGTFKK